MDDPVIVFGDDQSAHADRGWLWINNQGWPAWSVEIITAVREGREVYRADAPIRLDEWTPHSPRKAFAETGITRSGHNSSFWAHGGRQAYDASRSARPRTPSLESRIARCSSCRNKASGPQPSRLSGDGTDQWMSTCERLVSEVCR
jgi:hypothetical protein